MTRPVSSAAMSGGLRVGFHGVRGSTPCEGPQYARYGGHSSCVSVEARRPAADRVRSRHRSATRTATQLGAGEFHGPCCSPTCTGTTCRACRSSRRCTTRRRRSTSTVRGRPTGRSARCSRSSCARRSSRSDPTASAPTCASTTPATTTSRSASPRCGRASSATSGSTLGFRVEWGGRSVAYVPDHGPGCCPDDPDDYVPARHPRAVRRRRPADPRRAAHARGVRAEAALGSLDRRLRRARRTRVRREAARAVPPRPGARRRRARRIAVADGRSLRRARRSRGHRGLRRPRDRPRGPVDDRAAPHAQPRARDHADGRRSLRDRHHRSSPRSHDGEPVGMACNSFTSVSLDPPLVLFCAAKSSTTWPRIQAAGKWAANILGEDDEEVCRLFAQKDADRFAHMTFRPGRERRADPRPRARVLRLRDRGRARRRRPRDRRRPRAGARLPVRRQAAALLPRRVRPVRELGRRGWVRSRSARASSSRSRSSWPPSPKLGDRDASSRRWRTRRTRAPRRSPRSCVPAVELVLALALLVVRRSAAARHALAAACCSSSPSCWCGPRRGDVPCPCFGGGAPASRRPGRGRPQRRAARPRRARDRVDDGATVARDARLGRDPRRGDRRRRVGRAVTGAGAPQPLRRRRSSSAVAALKPVVASTTASAGLDQHEDPADQVDADREGGARDDEQSAVASRSSAAHVGDAATGRARERRGAARRRRGTPRGTR